MSSSHYRLQQSVRERIISLNFRRFTSFGPHPKDKYQFCILVRVSVGHMVLGMALAIAIGLGLGLVFR